MGLVRRFPTNLPGWFLKINYESKIMTEITSTSSSQRDWKDYLLPERIAPWKVFLPVDRDSSVLAVGLEGKDLASLARSYTDIDVYQCADSHIGWARQQGQSLAHDYRFNPVEKLDFIDAKYSAIAVKADVQRENLQIFWDLLKPGGALAWVGRPQNLPSAAQVRRQGFYEVRQYTFLTDTVLVPMGDRRFTRAGFQLINSVKLAGQILKMAYRLLLYLRCQNLVGKPQVMVARKPGGNLLTWRDRLGKLLGQPAADFSLRGGWERLLVQVLSEDGQVLGYAKVPETPMGASANAKEARILRKLNQSADLRVMVPKVLANASLPGRQVLVNPEDGFGPVKFSKDITPAHITFLATLARTARRDLTLSEWPAWQEICLWVQQGPFNSVSMTEAFQEAIQHCEETFAGQRIPFHLVHGDFSYWNILLGKEGILVVDWEHSEPVGPPFSDLIRFAVSRRSLTVKLPYHSQQFLVDPVAALNLEAEFQALQNLLKFQEKIVILAALYECWMRRHWQHSLI